MNKESVIQAIKFGMVGILNTAVDYACFYIMLTWVNLDKSLSQVVATAVAMCGSYIINKYWTFSQKDKTTRKQIAKFILTNLVSMTCTILFMNIFHDILHIHNWANTMLNVIDISYNLDGDIGIMFCKITASVLSLVINFLGNKFWVFNTHKAEE